MLLQPQKIVLLPSKYRLFYLSNSQLQSQINQNTRSFRRGDQDVFAAAAAQSRDFFQATPSNFQHTAEAPLDYSVVERIVYPSVSCEEL